MASDAAPPGPPSRYNTGSADARSLRESRKTANSIVRADANADALRDSGTVSVPHSRLTACGSVWPSGHATVRYAAGLDLSSLSLPPQAVSHKALAVLQTSHQRILEVISSLLFTQLGDGCTSGIIWAQP
jgi:hypothetical protein